MNSTIFDISEFDLLCNETLCEKSDSPLIFEEILDFPETPKQAMDVEEGSLDVCGNNSHSNNCIQPGDDEVFANQPQYVLSTVFNMHGRNQLAMGYNQDLTPMTILTTPGGRFLEMRMVEFDEFIHSEHIAFWTKKDPGPVQYLQMPPPPIKNRKYFVSNNNLSLRVTILKNKTMLVLESTGLLPVKITFSSDELKFLILLRDYLVYRKITLESNAEKIRDFFTKYVDLCVEHKLKILPPNYFVMPIDACINIEFFRFYMEIPLFLMQKLLRHVERRKMGNNKK